MTVIQKLDELVTIFTVPFNRFNLIPVGGRSTAIRLASGKVVLFASHPNDDATTKTLRELGETVSHIIALDAVHHLSLSHYIKMYPDAKVVGPKGLVKKRKDVKFDTILPDQPIDSELAKEMKVVHLVGHPNEEFVWYHEPSKTLVEADALFNLPCAAQKSGILASIFPNIFLRQMAPGGSMHSVMAKAFAKSNREAFVEATRTIDNLDFVRLVPCHGEVITATPGATTNAAKEAWRAVYSEFINDGRKSN